MHILKSQTLNDESLLQFARSLGTDLLYWDFGPIMEMKFDQNAKNYLFSDEVVPLHWDGAFFKEPLKLLFYCTESEGEGGETLFVNTEMIWEDFSEKEKEMCRDIRLIYKTEKLAHYGGQINVPLVQTHPITGKTIMRMAEKVRTKLNPVDLKILGAEDEEEFYQFMISKLYDPKYLHVHRWEKGDVVVCDNFTYLHGRKSLGKNIKRTFKRIQIL